MPLRPLHPCAAANCRELTRERYCPRHMKERPQRIPDRRASPQERGYTYQWRKASKEHLAAYPWCAECLRQGRRELATEVDHVIPHKGNQALFWDRSNWQSLCHRCHSRKTAKEDGGFGFHRKF